MSPQRQGTNSDTASGGDIGLARHIAAVNRLRRDYRSLPADAPVRLAKPTSNLFRFREPTSAPALDVSAFSGVISIDPVERLADVGGMTTYEDLVAATLPHGLMPTVVPQLRTITLGGAVTGMGIESSSFRNGLPHEAVQEMEILTGSGDIVTATRDNAHADLFHGFPNSYGTLGYSLRLRIELEPVSPYVHLRHLRFHDAAEAMDALARICDDRSHDGQPVDFVDGVAFSRDELYLTVARFTDRAPWASDYTGQEIYYRSIQANADNGPGDYLTVHDYLWRWDTDWFWCSRALGVQNPVVRSLWPRSLKRSDVYRRVVAWDRRTAFSRLLNHYRGRRPQEPLIQDIEVGVERGAEFLDFFHEEIGVTPVWICPMRLKEPRRADLGPGGHVWPLYPLENDRLYVNFGFWGMVDMKPGQRRAHHNRRVEERVAELGGHKSLYSDSFYTEEEFWRLYNGSVYADLKETYDPRGRLLDLYAKCVRNG
ncbi:FAD-binding oxidoreductase [Nocardiopsis changdeensis]|uniref:Delta(24)-sterol reductase n=1 Tax=Nocardiopsis changdeensis TaxID=2831969 RepID=A0ABX8BPV4_9ACTN|nr:MULTISPECIES: FAD-binding oxidoreductase [Nocardiopsis]QUX24274.1 FAD-binding oxidoreductase [Nocardiopsis changdeensis]QYX34666.1 FAD-binding oxidoreductase [Nocardiopsis sp. MT53]